MVRKWVQGSADGVTAHATSASLCGHIESQKIVNSLLLPHQTNTVRGAVTTAKLACQSAIYNNMMRYVRPSAFYLPVIGYRYHGHHT